MKRQAVGLRQGLGVSAWGRHWHASDGSSDPSRWPRSSLWYPRLLLFFAGFSASAALSTARLLRSRGRSARSCSAILLASTGLAAARWLSAGRRAAGSPIAAFALGAFVAFEAGFVAFLHYWRLLGYP